MLLVAPTGTCWDWFVGHIFGDWLFGQNDWMAFNKKEKGWKGFLACSLHCLIYTFWIIAFTHWPIWTWPVIFVTHFAIDRTKFVGWFLKKMGRSKLLEEPMHPWAWITVDNSIHYVSLYFIWKLLIV